jgi:adenylate cyclase
LTIERELLVRPKGVSREQVLFHVTGIGEPYNVSIKVKNDTPKALREPIPVYFSLIREKHTLEERHYAGITAIGRGTCVMETEVALNVYDNLQVQAGGRLLCKVLDVNSGSCLLQFTSIPAGFSDWVKARSI